jgi:hypothetical protein
MTLRDLMRSKPKAQLVEVVDESMRPSVNKGGIAFRCNTQITKTALRFHTLLLHDGDRGVHFERVTLG